MSASLRSSQATHTPTTNLAMSVLERWRHKPATFVKDVFKISPEPWQETVLSDLANHGRVSVRSGHGVGKSAVDAWAILWFMNVFYPCKIPCTAPTSHQLEDILWPELAKWYRRMPDDHQAYFNLRADRLEAKFAPKESFAVARTARPEQPEALQGFHSDNLLFVLDEASAIADIVFEVSEGALSTPGARVLMTSNPTRTSGYFFDSHNRSRARWRPHRVSCLDSSLVAADYATGMAERYGADSNVYRVRVLGDFPISEDDVVIPLQLLEAAVGRTIDKTPVEKIIWGLDVARFGDDSNALAKRQLRRLMEPVREWRGKDLMQTTGMVMNEYLAQPDALKPDVIMVDSIGLGAGVVDRLRELGAPAMGCNVAESSSTKQLYNRLRDELWFKGREWFASLEVTMPDDDETLAELSVAKYKYTSTGKLQVESKDEMKKRGIHSPNRADAFLMTFATTDLRPTYDKPIAYSDDGII